MTEERTAQVDSADELSAGLPTHAHGAPQNETRSEATGEAEGARVARPRASSVWQFRDFRIVAVGEAISALGDAITFTALPLLVLVLTGSGAAMGVVAALQT